MKQNFRDRPFRWPLSQDLCDNRFLYWKIYYTLQPLQCLADASKSASETRELYSYSLLNIRNVYLNMCKKHNIFLISLWPLWITFISIFRTMFACPYPHGLVIWRWLSFQRLYFILGNPPVVDFLFQSISVECILVLLTHSALNLHQFFSVVSVCLSAPKLVWGSYLSACCPSWGARDWRQSACFSWQYRITSFQSYYARHRSCWAFMLSLFL